MSAIRTRRNSTKAQIIKLDNCETQSPSKTSGKPCIDFQPDDRWQIKEDNDDSSDSVNCSTGKKKDDDNVKSPKPKSSIINGESTNHVSDSENSENGEVSSSSKVADDSSECNKETPSKKSTVKPNCRMRKKRKNSSPNKTNGKKAKSSKENDSDDSIISCSSDNEGKVKSVEDSELEIAKDEEKLTSKDDEKLSSKDEENLSIKDEENLSIKDDENLSIKDDENLSIKDDEKLSVKEEEKLSINEEKKLSSKEDEELSNKDEELSIKDEEKLSIKDKKLSSNDEEKLSTSVAENETKPVSDEDEEDKTTSVISEKVSNDNDEKSELSKSEDSKEQKDEKSEKTSDDNVIEIDDDDDDDKKDSDNEIEIIEGTDDASPKVPKKETPRLEEQMSLAIVGDSKLSKEEILLSAGYPYYNSIAEKIKNFKAGTYNPVKFPHMGTLYLSDTEVIIESPSLLVPLLIKESDEFPKLDSETEDSSSKQKPIFRKNFFQSSVGQFLINLGASRVFEWYHRDMKRVAAKQARKSQNKQETEEAIQMHDKKCNEAKEANIAFNHRMRKCQHCDFKSESLVVMEAHYLIPHISQRREFKCNFCTFLTRDPKEITFHFEAIHRKKASLENQMLLHECLFCTFQSHLKSKVTIHMTRCKKNFIQGQNQSPPYDFEFPGVTTKPVSLADISGHRRMLLGSVNVKGQPGSFESFVQNAFAKRKMTSVLSLPGMENYPENPTIMKHLMGPQGKQANSSYQLPPGIVLTRPRVRGQGIRQVAPNLQPRNMGTIRPGGAVVYPNNIPSGISITPVQKDGTKPGAVKSLTLTPISSSGNQVVAKGGPPQPVALFTNVAGSDASRNRMSGMAPGKMPIAIGGRSTRMVPPYQRLNTPPSQVVKNSSGSTFVMCEICDSYIKDLEELRSHMNWVHKVKIHPKMLVSRPPLNCQKCQWRFFTDQGLERHLLGAHGLVTTNMQEMANNNQDGGRCIICGAVFTYKLVSHMTQVHKVTLKPAHLSYKCTVCTATFTLYRLFESHVYNVHSGTAKRTAEEPAPSEPPAKKVTIIEVKEEVKQPVSRKCKDCGFITEFLEDHIRQKHMKDCTIKLCRIDKCKKCLYSTDEMLVIRMSDMDSDEESESDSSEDDDDDSSSESNSKKETCITIE